MGQQVVQIPELEVESAGFLMKPMPVLNIRSRGLTCVITIAPGIGWSGDAFDRDPAG
jgi:hypothetical protein